LRQLAHPRRISARPATSPTTGRTPCAATLTARRPLAAAAVTALAALTSLTATVAALGAAIASLCRPLSALTATVAALALTRTKSASLSGTKPALTLATVSSALTRRLGLPRESALTESAAKTLLAALLAHSPRDTGQMRVSRGRLPVVVVGIDLRRSRRRNQRKVSWRLRLEFVVLVVLVIKEPIGVIRPQRRIKLAGTRCGSSHLLVARLAIKVVFAGIDLARRGSKPPLLAGIRLTGSSRRCLGISSDLLEHGGERRDITGIEFDPPAADQSGRQTDRTKADPNQPRDDQTHCLEDPAHFAVASFADDDAIPVVGPVASHIFKRQEVRRAIFERHAGEQLFSRLVVDSTEDAHRIFAFPAKPRMHQQIGQFTRGGKHQQAFGIEVEASDGDPALTLESGQSLKHRGPLTGVIAAADFTRRLVIKQDFRRRFLHTTVERAAVDPDLIGRTDALADISRLAVDRDPPCNDEFFHFTTRADTGISQQLVQLGRIVIEFTRRGPSRRVAPARIGRIDADLCLARIDRNELIGVGRTCGVRRALTGCLIILGTRTTWPARPLTVAARPPAIHSVSGPFGPASIILTRRTGITRLKSGGSQISGCRGSRVPAAGRLPDEALGLGVSGRRGDRSGASSLRAQLYTGRGALIGAHGLTAHCRTARTPARP